MAPIDQNRSCDISPIPSFFLAHPLSKETDTSSESLKVRTRVRGGARRAPVLLGVALAAGHHVAFLLLGLLLGQLGVQGHGRRSFGGDAETTSERPTDLGDLGHVAVVGYSGNRTGTRVLATGLGTGYGAEGVANHAGLAVVTHVHGHGLDKDGEGASNLAADGLGRES